MGPGGVLGAHLGGPFIDQVSDLGVEQHREFADDSAIWISTGRRLLASADVLWVEVDKHFTAVRKIFQAAKDVRPGETVPFDDERLEESLKECAARPRLSVAGRIASDQSVRDNRDVGVLR